MTKRRRLKEAHSVLADLGMPRQQMNDRSALCLLAMLNLPPGTSWSEAETPCLE